MSCAQRKTTLELKFFMKAVIINRFKIKNTLFCCNYNIFIELAIKVFAPAP